MAVAPTLILRARAVLPIWRPPIEDGAVVLSGNRILSVGEWKSAPDARLTPVQDLGDSIILPGLINAHCHLDYTHMAGLFPPPKKFTDWIKLITTEKASWSYSDYARSWIDGAQQLLRSGTTTVADIEAVPELLPDVWNATPLRVISHLEMTGVKSRRSPDQILAEALETIRSLEHARSFAALSPHAPYSTTGKLLQRAAAAARKRKLPITTHVAESCCEFEMFMHAQGEMFSWLHRNQRDMSDCGRGSPVRHLARHRLLGANLLAVHANYLASGDAQLLARKKVSIIHCPRSHVYFGHAPFPFRKLAGAGVNICLGTDSLATTRTTRKSKPELNLFREMEAFANANTSMPEHKILKLATMNAARALGMPGKLGELNHGAFGDLIVLPHPGRRSQVGEAVIHHKGDVLASMIDGQWAIAPK